MLDASTCAERECSQQRMSVVEGLAWRGRAQRMRVRGRGTRLRVQDYTQETGVFNEGLMAEMAKEEIGEGDHQPEH